MWPEARAYSGGVFTVNGSGADIEDNADAFNYVYQPLNGDATIVARVAHAPEYGSLGQGRRDDPRDACGRLDPGHDGRDARQRHRLSAADHDRRHHLPVRPAPLSSPPTGSRSCAAATRSSGYSSADGVAWDFVGSDTISMTSNVFVGLALTSHDNAVLNTSTMDNVSVLASTPTPTPTSTPTLTRGRRRSRRARTRP